MESSSADWGGNGVFIAGVGSNMLDAKSSHSGAGSLSRAWPEDVETGGSVRRRGTKGISEEVLLMPKPKNPRSRSMAGRGTRCNT